MNVDGVTTEQVDANLEDLERLNAREREALADRLELELHRPISRYLHRPVFRYDSVR